MKNYEVLEEKETENMNGDTGSEQKNDETTEKSGEKKPNETDGNTESSGKKETIWLVEIKSVSSL